MTTSHWQATHPASSLSTDLPTTADVVVIGGGILGACAAYWLARESVDVVLLEQESLAAGATGRNGGFLTVGAAESYPAAIRRWGHPTAKAIWQLTYDNRDLLRGVMAEENIACDYREPGCLHLSLNDDEWVATQEAVELLNADGFTHDVLDRQQTQKLIGATLSEDVRGASLLLNGGLLHSAKLVAGLALAAQRHGAMPVQARVTNLAAFGHAVRINTDRGVISANGLVVAANAWLGQLMPQLRSVIMPVRGQMLSFEPIEPVFAHGFGAALTEAEEYWQQTPDGTIVLGGCRAVRPDRDLGVLSNDVTDDVQCALEGVLPRLFPSLAGRLRVARRWAGPMAFTPDYLPVADCVPDLPNTWFAGGFCGHGMPFGMVFGKLLAEGVVTGQKPSALVPFALRDIKR